LVEEREEIAYGRGLLDGRAIKEDELDDAKAEITRLKFQVENLRCDLKRDVSNAVYLQKQNFDQGREINKIKAEINKLKAKNMSISQNLRKRLTAVPHT